MFNSKPHFSIELGFCDLIRPFTRIFETIQKQYAMQDGKNRSNIQIGSDVEIVQKQHQRTGELTNGIVKRILTKSPNHPHGIKVQLESGEVGRVKKILEE